MTDVQKFTIERTLADEDVIGQAKTGTGKTLAFLIPLANKILNNIPRLITNRKLSGPERPTAGDTRALIVSPTRELAEQIAEEARRLLVGTQTRVQLAVGGTMRRDSLRRMQVQGCHLLVATPGRLKDLLQDPTSGVTLDNLDAFVLDEADRLLDDGFFPEIRDIISTFPRDRPRQTLLFSATMSPEVRRLASQVIKPAHSFISTVDPNEPPTHERIPQHLVITRGYENMAPALLEICQRRLAEDPNFKAVVFFNSTAEVSFARSLFAAIDGGRNTQGRVGGRGSGRGPLGRTDIYELHGRLTQAQRTAAATGFRSCRAGLLFCSDVAARGMDFPGVTDVIQVNAPEQLDTYIHRIGRTGRAGRDGQGWLIAPKVELSEMRHLARLPLKANPAITTAGLDLTTEADLSDDQTAIVNTVRDAAARTDEEKRQAVYSNILFRNVTNRDHRRNCAVAAAVNDLAVHGWGMEAAPAVRPPRDIASALRSTPGITFAPRDMGDFGGRRGGRGVSYDDYSNGPVPGESAGRSDGFRGGDRRGRGGFRGGAPWAGRGNRR